MAWKQCRKIDEMATADVVTNTIIKYQQRHGLLSNMGSETTTFEIQTRDMCAPPWGLLYMWLHVVLVMYMYAGN